MITQADSRKWMACLYNSFLFKVKTSNKSEWTTRAVDLRKAVTQKGFGEAANKIKDYNADATKKTAKFGIDFKSVTTTVGSTKTTTNYAIIVFEAGANS